MEKLFGKEKESASIIKREEALLPDYAPAEVLHRKAELEEIAEAIKPLAERKLSTNLFVHGLSGAGKTTSVRHVLKEFSEFSSKVISVYVNCWEFSTQMGVYSCIVRALQEPLPRRGLAVDEAFDRILERMEKDKLAILLVLDELDGLIFRHEDELLYSLARANERKGVVFGIIGISCDPYLLRKLDARVSSSLRFSQLQFKQYSTEQLTEILAERSKIAFFPGTWDKKVLNSCAEYGASNQGNTRLAMEVLWKSAHHAENRNSNQIQQEDVTAVLKKTTVKGKKKSPFPQGSFELRNLKLSEEEELLVELLKGGEKLSSDLYDAFIAKKAMTKRQIRNYIDTLEAKGLIEITESESQGDVALKPRLIKLKKVV